MPSSRYGPPIGGALSAALLATAAAAPGRTVAEPPPITLHGLPSGALPSLPYWPFAWDEADLPALDAVPIDVTMASRGCGALSWSTHPVPGSHAAGPFCVALLEGGPLPLLVVGRPGEAPYVLVPARIGIDDGAVMVERPIAALPSVVEAVRRWAAAPEVGP